MRASIPTPVSSLKANVWLACVTFAFPLPGLADLRGASEPPPPRTPLDARNAFFTLVGHWVLLAIATAALAWMIWWGIRLRRKWFH